MPTDIQPINTLLNIVEANIRRKDIVDAIFKLRKQIKVAPGSSGNHQNWPGGYVDHILQCIYMANSIRDGILCTTKNSIPFAWESVIVVLVLHDIEKVFKYSDPPVSFDKKQFLDNLSLTQEELDAIRYIHGEGDDYRKDKRVMSELCAICHAADIISARVLHSDSFKIKQSQYEHTFDLWFSIKTNEPDLYNCAAEEIFNSIDKRIADIRGNNEIYEAIGIVDTIEIE